MPALDLHDDMAAILQARMSGPSADACATDLTMMFGRRMRDCPLTCKHCKNAPATHLLVADLRGGRQTWLVCGPCGNRGKGDAAWIAAAPSAIWLFALVPAATERAACRKTAEADPPGSPREIGGGR